MSKYLNPCLKPSLHTFIFQVSIHVHVSTHILIFPCINPHLNPCLNPMSPYFQVSIHFHVLIHVTIHVQVITHISIFPCLKLSIFQSHVLKHFQGLKTRSRDPCPSLNQCSMSQFNSCSCLNQSMSKSQPMFHVSIHVHVPIHVSIHFPSLDQCVDRFHISKIHVWSFVHIRTSDVSH